MPPSIVGWPHTYHRPSIQPVFFFMSIQLLNLGFVIANGQWQKGFRTYWSGFRTFPCRPICSFILLNAAMHKCMFILCLLNSFLTVVSAFPYSLQQAMFWPCLLLVTTDWLSMQIVIRSFVNPFLK